MTPIAIEWLNLLVRWIHVIAGIMWIGDSFLFMWMDRSLSPPSRPRAGAVDGELWMVHSGAFYEVVKRKVLAPGELPKPLHWFKWEAYTTWISGFFLLGIVYWLGRGIYLLDGSAPGLGAGGAVALSAGLLVASWFIYDALWRSPLGRNATLAGLISFALVIAAAYGLTRVFSGRAAYLELGAMLGTIMAANVWRVIVPAQRGMIAATAAGKPADATLGARAKARSTHNHYLTLPVLFTMLSNHFPGTYGHSLNWLVLVLLMVVGAAAKYVMNFRGGGHRWIGLAGGAALIAVVALTTRVPHAGSASGGHAFAGRASFASARGILERRCVGCHAAKPSNPSFPEPPSGITLEDPTRIASLAPRILVRAVQTRTMPLGNLTGMTDAERDTLAAWIAQGARVDRER